MARLPTPGGDSDNWGSVLNDFLGVEHNPDGTLKKSGQIDSAEQTTNKGQPGGYASLDAISKVPAVQLGGSGADTTTFLRGDRTWVAPPSVADATSSGKGIVQLAGDLSGTATSPTVPGLAATEKTANKGAANGYAPLDGTSKVPIANLPTGTTGTAVAVGNDARITGALQTSVATTKGDVFAATAASTITRLGVGSDGQVLSADSTQTPGLKWTTPASSLPPSGAASGDLSGTYPSPTVAKVNGVALPGSAPTANQVLTATSASATTWQTPASAPVGSVFGRTGAVMAQTGDYTATQVGAVSTSGGGKENTSSPTASSASTTIDLANGNVQVLTLNASTTISLTGATNGVACSISLYLKQDATGSRTVTWPASVKWPSGAAPVLSTGATKIDLVVLETIDGGTTWYGTLAGADFR